MKRHNFDDLDKTYGDMMQELYRIYTSDISDCEDVDQRSEDLRQALSKFDILDVVEMAGIVGADYGEPEVISCNHLSVAQLVLLKLRTGIE